MTSNLEKPLRDAYLGSTKGSEDELPRRMKMVLSVLPDLKVRNYLDVGCGDGNFTALVKQRLGSANVYGIDFSPKAVELAKEKGINALCVDLAHDPLPFESELFDAIFAGEVIEHIFDTDHFLDEISRVLRSDGHLILSTPNLASMHNRIALLLGFEPFTSNPSLHYGVGHLQEFRSTSEIVPSGDHIRVMTLRSLKQLLRIHGFRIEKVFPDGANLPAGSFALRALRTFDAVLSKSPRLSYRVVLVCTKTHRPPMVSTH